MAPIKIFILLLLVTAFIGLYINSISQKNNSGLHPDLIKAAGGNKALASRLMEQVKIKYPGKTDRWYREKVIYDLGRDRGVIKASRRNFSINRRELKENIFLIGGVLWVLNSFTTLMSRWFK